MLYTSAVIGDNTLKALNGFRHNNVFCDIVITVQGQKFPAHKAVLAANSQYLRQCLLKQNVSTFNLNLQLTNAKNFEDVLEFLYTCKLELNESKLAEVLMIGTFLQISEISNLTSKFMVSLHNQDCTKSEVLSIDDDPGNIFGGNPNDKQILGKENLHEGPNEFPSVSFVTSTCESQGLSDSSPTTNDLPQAFIQSPSTSGDNVSSSSNRNIIEIESLDEFSSLSENRSPVIFTEPARVTFPISPFESAAKRKRCAPRKITPSGEIEVISDDNIYACHGCFAPFENHKDFLSHQCNTLICKFCGHQSKSRPCLAKHERTHTSDRIYWCPICQANFTRRDSLKEHLLKRSNGLCGNKMIQMDLDVDGILKGCKNPLNYEQAALYEGAHFQCEHCRENFSSFAAMELHCKQVHEVSIDKRCPICGLVFKQDLWFNNHLEYHSLYPVEMPVDGCESEIYRFMCQLCEKQFTSEVEYGVHKAKNCRDKCRYCSFVCTLKVHLERHVRTHTGERPYICFECNKSYMRRDNLLTHLKTKHQMQMPKFCRLEQQPTVVQIRGSEIKILTNQINGGKHMNLHPNNSDTEAHVTHSRTNLQQSLTLDAF